MKPGIALLVVGAAACGADPVAPAPASDLSGVYTQRTFAPDWWRPQDVDSVFDPGRTTARAVTLGRDSAALVVTMTLYVRSGTMRVDSMPSHWTATRDTVTVLGPFQPMANPADRPVRFGFQFRRVGADTLVNASDTTVFVRTRR